MEAPKLPLRRQVRLHFWSKWLSPEGAFKDARLERLRTDRELPKWAIEALPSPLEDVRILDVNAGPVSALGTHINGKPVDLVPIDELANPLNAVLKRNGFEPPVQTLQCCAEDVQLRFGIEAFDLIYSFNGLDYTPDPLSTYRQLLECLKPGGTIITFHQAAVDSEQVHREHFRFFHAIQNGTVILQQKSLIQNLQEGLPLGEVQASEDNGIIRLEIRRRRNPKPIASLPDPLPKGKQLPCMVSMHLPKTAGTSFRLFLESLYGNSFRPMYSREETAPVLIGSLELDSKTRCLHGHFQANAFDSHLPQSIKLTWLRNPVERVISSYFQYIREPELDLKDPFNQQFFEEGWSLLEFARHESIRRQLRWYFNAVPMEDFFFIGISEYFKESMKLLCYSLNIQPSGKSASVNTNPARKRNLYDIPESTRRELENLYTEDIDLYQRAHYRLKEHYRQAFGAQLPDLDMR